MRIFILFLIMVLGTDLYAILDPGPAYKYKPVWIPPEEGTSSIRILNKKEQEKKAELLKKFKERYPEYTLIFDARGIIKEINVPADARSKNPMPGYGYYIEALEPLFIQFKDLFGIGTEALQHIPSTYKGLPVFEHSSYFAEIIPPYSKKEGTWTLIVGRPNELQETDIIPQITGTQAYEIAINDLDSHFGKSNPGRRSYYEIFDIAKFPSFIYELPEKPIGNIENYTITKYGLATLGILIHKDIRPYLVWEVQIYPWPWLYYIDAKRGKALYGEAMIAP
ncbi:MAG: hypothetical protein QME07_04055 [bacterium]|nr:hypothetical protein [bacterium]